MVSAEVSKLPASLIAGLLRATRSVWPAFFAALLATLAGALPVYAQVVASITGIVTDPSGAPISAAAVTAKNLETGAVRSTATDDAGRYLVLSLAVGQYEVRVTKAGFKEAVRSGIQLAIGQEARVDLNLQVGAVETQVIVASDVLLVATTTSDISGLVGARQIKELPLNGRSYDLLLQLNPGIVNLTSLKTGGTGISNSTTANNFAVSGNRPQQNLFLLNGVEYTGAAENNMKPGGASGMLLGVDAVREFNVQRDSYGAEFGKHPGGQVIIVTQSGSNHWHGAAIPTHSVRRLRWRSAPSRQDFPLRQLRRFSPAPTPDFRGFRSRPGRARGRRTKRSTFVESVAHSSSGYTGIGYPWPDLRHIPSL